MGKGIVYCHVCGNRILESEFRNKRALTLLGRSYCPKCATKEVIEQAAKSKREEKAEPLRATTRRKGETGRIPTSTRGETRKRGPRSRMPLVVAAVVVAVALILLIIALTSRG